MSSSSQPTMNDYFLLWPMIDDPLIAEPSWLAEYLSRYQHPQCRHLSQPPPSEPEITVRSVGQDIALSFVDRLTTGVVRSDLRELLEPQFSTYLETTGLRFEGEILDERCAYRDPAPVVIRGDKKSYCWQCEVCSRWIYYPMGRWYLLEDRLKPEPIFSTEMGGLVVNGKLAERILQRKWRKVRIDPLPVKSSPTDGFSSKIEETPIELQKRPVTQ